MNKISLPKNRFFFRAKKENPHTVQETSSLSFKLLACCIIISLVGVVGLSLINSAYAQYSSYPTVPKTEKKMAEEEQPEEEGGETYAKGMSSDGSVQVEIETSTPVSGQPLSLAITFHDNNGAKIKHVNYALVATQGGNQVLSKSDGHTHTGEDSYTTSALASAGT